MGRLSAVVQSRSDGAISFWQAILVCVVLIEEDKGSENETKVANGEVPSSMSTNFSTLDGYAPTW